MKGSPPSLHRLSTFSHLQRSARSQLLTFPLDRASICGPEELLFMEFLSQRED